MNWYLIFYLFSLADKIATVFGTITVLSGIWLVVNGFIGLLSTENWEDNDWSNFRKSLWGSIITFLFSVTLWTFIPTKKDMLLIIGGGAVGQFIINDENAKEIPSDLMMLLRKEILEATSEIGDESVKSALGIENKKETLMKKSKEELIKMLEESEK